MSRESQQGIPRTQLRRAAAPTMERLARDAEAVESETVRSMVEFIGEHLFERRLTVQSVKKAFDIRDNSVALRFHAELGVPPNRYISTARLDIASKLLAETDLPAWRIAEAIGYSSIQVFSRAFLRERGQRPNAFRHATRGNGDAPNDSEVALGDSTALFQRAARGELSAQEAGALIRQIAAQYFDLPQQPTTTT